ncbi:putative quinol monooxygenase [Thalassotalea sp. PLHSN55]|uniref:putative quinol monooxygenase n=1 Tax=Thalassotalea sp. PLHSN55 TaxID=3435888 RepID=UPI003F85FFE7
MITQIIKFDIKTEYIDNVKTALIAEKQNIEKNEECLEFSLFQDKNQPSKFFIYQRFNSIEAMNTQTNQSSAKHLINLLSGASNSAPQVMKLTDTNPAPLHEKNPKSANDEDDLFIIFFIFKIKPDYREQLLAQFNKHVTCTRTEEEGCIIFDLYTVEGQEDTLAVYEHWRKESDVWDIHFNQPYAVETGELMHKAVIGELEQYMNFVTEIGIA